MPGDNTDTQDPAGLSMEAAIKQVSQSLDGDNAEGAGQTEDDDERRAAEKPESSETAEASDDSDPLPGDEDEDNADGQGDEEDEGDEGAEEPAEGFFDEQIKAALKESDPASYERLIQQEKGVLKMQRQYRELQARTETYTGIEDAIGLSDESAADALADIARVAAEHHKVAPEALVKRIADTLGVKMEAVEEAAEDPYEEVDGQPLWEREGFFSVKEWEQDRRLKKLEAQLEATEKANRERSMREAEEARFKKYAEGVAPRVIKSLSSQFQGWGVTPKMVAKALKDHPALAGDPETAVLRTYGAELKAHLKRQTAADRSRGHVIPDTQTSKGTKVDLSVINRSRDISHDDIRLLSSLIPE